MRSIILKASLYAFLFLSPFIVFSQGNPNEEKQFIPESQKGAQVFKHARVLNDQTETIEVTGLSSPTFTVSNLVDGTAESFNHKLRITYTLQTTGGKGSYQLVFFGDDEKVPYAVNAENGVTTIYMPYVVHDHLKSKLDQSLSAKKKVQLKITSLTTGVREAVWIL